MASGSPQIRVLELFSGLGGMHWALKEADVNFTVMAAMDINEAAGKVYRHNFPSVPHVSSNICGLTVDRLRQLSPEAVVMSPPCQPFTRQGLQKDLEDNRTQPLKHLLQVLPEVHTIKYLLLENVKGFESSDARDRVLETLRSMDFVFREFLLSPVQLGIPNSRLRYYLIARKSILGDFPHGNSGVVCSDVEVLRPHATKLKEFPSTLKSYLDDTWNGEDYSLEDKLLFKYAETLDLVCSDSSRSCCFTKAYAKYATGTGSILYQAGSVDDVYSRMRILPKEDFSARVKVLKELKMRYFSPSEVSRLMAFPPDFTFPEETPCVHRYRLLGNSINVAVVSFVIQLLFSPVSLS